jgi:protease-4
LPEKDVEEIADGRVLTGETAQQLKLVDELGNFNDAVNAAAVLANIPGEPEIVYAEKKKFSVVDFLLGEEATAMIHNFLNGASQPVRYQAPFPFSP